MVSGNSIGEHSFRGILTFIMILIMLITFYPFYYAIVNSLNDGNDLYRGFVMLWPRVFSNESWKTVLSDQAVLRALLLTATRTVVVTVLSIVNTAMFAYAFSRHYLRGKPFYAAIGFVSMYFSGGIIPYFLLISWLGMYDNYWVYIIPSLFGGFWNVIIFNSNFKALPDALFESAQLDGANEFQIFGKLVLPLSKPVIAALSVFTAVGIWNDYTTTLYYTQSKSLQTLQYYILEIVKSYNAIEQLQNSAMANNAAIADLLTSTRGTGPVTAKTIELSAMVLAAIPMIVLYPFAQKFFVKGMLVGSVKG